ncbi:MAG: hypothetical protein ACJ76Y_21865 [Thermoanaerobaculia bacterium]
MAFKLRILFDGLCILVPNTEESKGMRVLMIDARAPGVASNGENQVSHIPSVRFKLADLVPGRRQPSYRVEYAGEESVPRGQWYLNGDDLEIRVDGHGLPDEPLKVLHSHPTRDFSLIPSMKAIYPEYGGVDVREECLDNNLTRLTDAGLVGRLRLKAGAVGAWDGHDGRFISSDEYMFSGNPARHRQRLSSRTFFEADIVGEEVEIFSRQRGHGLVLRPENGAELEILFENQPPAGLMTAKPADPNADYDFELVYLIAKNPPLPLRIPVLATAAWEASALSGLSGEAGAYDRVICPGTSYNPNNEASVDNPKCPPVTYNSNSEATSTGVFCPPAAFNPNSEASGENRPICPGTIYNPSSEARIQDRVICPPSAYNPSSEAAQSAPPCSPVAFNPSSEATDSKPLCPPVAYNPSGEASPDSRPICPMTTYNPHPEA